MRRTLPLSEAPPTLAELLAGMVGNEELELTENGRPVAVVTKSPSPGPWPCQPGSAKADGGVYWMAPDFNAPLDLREADE